MFTSGWVNTISRSDILPPLHVTKKVKESKEWKIAVMDAFEYIGIRQFQENLSFWDFYRMVEGKMAYQELREVVPLMDSFQDLLDGVGIPTFLRHYDIIGIIINALVNKWSEMDDKFHVTDTGEVAQNEFLRFKTDQIQKTIQEVIQNEVQIHLAKNGLNPEGKQFNSPEEQQAFLEQLEQAKAQYTPEETLRQSTKSFKTLGIQWGEATLEKDNLLFKIPKLNRTEMRDHLLSGRWFREYKVGYDKYYPKRWHPINTFFSKEIDNQDPRRCQYIGRLHFYTPNEVIAEYGHKLNANQTKDILGGNEDWKSFVGNGVAAGSIESAIKSNFNRPESVPFGGYHDYNFFLGLQDELGVPLGEYRGVDKHGDQVVYDRFLPRYAHGNLGRYTSYAKVLRDDFIHRTDLCQVTEVYFIAYDLYGYITYENEFGRLVREEVTEDILPEFIKEKGIKQVKTKTIEEIQENLEPNTLYWTYIPNTYEGVKIQSPYMNEAIYLYCKKMDYQIKGDSEFDRLLPVCGHIGGTSVASKLAPYQAKYNLCMNQIYSLLEKEIGMFFLLDVAFIPNDYSDSGDTEDALFKMMQTAKDVGIVPVATSGDRQKNENNFNQFSIYDISYTNQIRSRVDLAEFQQRKAYEQIGINPILQSGPSTYTTATGVKLSNEASWMQTAEIFNDFSDAQMDARELHLAVAQYAQSNKKDLSLFYTKSDGSIKYLQMSDPQLPLRRLGIVPNADNKKRKELETLQQLFINNFGGSDILDVAAIIGSDAYSDVMEIAKAATKRKQEQEALTHDRSMEEIKTQGQNQAAIQQARDDREDARLNKKLAAGIQEATINAAGRAADKDSDAAGFDFIERTANIALKESNLLAKEKSSAANLKLQEKVHNDNFELKKQELLLKLKELDTKKQNKQIDQNIAVINPG